MNILFPTWKSFGVEDIKKTFEELGHKVSLYEREPKNYRIDPRYKSEIKKYIKENDIDNHIISYQSKMNNIKRGTKRDGMDMMDRISAYRELIRKNIDYENYPPIYNKQEVDELIDLIVETLMLPPDAGTIRIGGKERPVSIVKSMFLKLDKDHICYILKCLHNTEKKIGNIKAYLLTALYNAPMTIQNYYTNLANCDLAPDNRQK